MNLFGNIFGAKKTESQTSMPLSDETLEKIIEGIKSETSVPCMKLVLKDGTPSLTDSKLGGLPYIPHNENFPLDAQNRQLKLLAQINCQDIQGLQNFPSSGLLQFFVASNRLFGLNTASPTEQTGFAVKYYETVDETVTEDEIKAKIAVSEDSAKPKFPLNGGPFKLEFEAGTDFISASDFRFEKLLIEKADVFCPNCGIKSLFDLSDEQQQMLSKAFSGGGSKIAGYPRFSQDDPRGITDKNLQSFDTLLLQLESDGENIDYGDFGAANFFIEQASLAARSFSKVLYNWDCM